VAGGLSPGDFLIDVHLGFLTVIALLWVFDLGSFNRWKSVGRQAAKRVSALAGGAQGPGNGKKD
jgi:hypothetical protein